MELLKGCPWTTFGKLKFYALSSELLLLVFVLFVCFAILDITYCLPNMESEYLAFSVY